MKIHDKGPNGVPVASRPISPNKRRKPPRRKLSVEDDGEKINNPPNKKVWGCKRSCVLSAVAWIFLLNLKGCSIYHVRCLCRTNPESKALPSVRRTCCTVQSASRHSSVNMVWSRTWRHILTPHSGEYRTIGFARGMHLPINNFNRILFALGVTCVASPSEPIEASFVIIPLFISSCLQIPMDDLLSRATLPYLWASVICPSLTFLAANSLKLHRYRLEGLKCLHVLIWLDSLVI